MNLLRELHNLHEAEVPGENKIEVADLIKHFPTKYEKAIEKLWGTPRLAYHGHSILGGDNDIYDQLDKAVKHWGKTGTVSVSLSSIDFKLDGEEFSIDLDYDEPIEDPNHNGQECYMGYDPKSDHLFSGWDIGFNEEIFNEEWDKAFEDATGVPFDYDDKEHEAAFKKAHDEWKDLRPWILFELKFEGDELTVVDTQSADGGFYPAGHKLAQADHLVDLRLD